MATYFVSRERGTNGQPVKGTFWRTYQSFKVIKVHINLHLLAYAVGDRLPRPLAGTELVPPQSYCVTGLVSPEGEPVRCDGDEIRLQPWAVKEGNEIRPLPIGSRLRDFLDDPLGTGERMNLALPFADQGVELTGGWVRARSANDDPDGAFHGGFDFRDVTESPRVLFPVVAAADGVVKRADGGSICIQHVTAKAAEFYTIYKHLDTSTFQVAKDQTVRAGEVLGHVGRWRKGGGDISHLHFTVAVKRAAFNLGSQRIPELWYAIDPFGVYDYHREGSDTTYIPTRPGGLEETLRGRSHTLQFREDPLIRSFPAEIKTDYHPVTEMTVRVRNNADQTGTDWPGETNTLCVRLNGADQYFWLPLQMLQDTNAERQLIETLRMAQTEGKWVSLGYRWVGGQRIIAAVWVRR